MTLLPPDLQQLTDAMNTADRQAEALASRLDDEAFFWQPEEGRRWSVALCLDHLTVSNSSYGAALQQAVREAKARGWTRQAPAAPGFIGRKFVASLEPPVKRRASAPAKIRPRPGGSREDILRVYREAHDLIRSVIAEAADVDINRASFRNPLLPILRVKVSTGLQVIAAHDRRHLWQAAQVEEEFRRSTGGRR